jgi:penicillin-insensitive murein endopeptidase
MGRRLRVWSYTFMQWPVAASITILWIGATAAGGAGQPARQPPRDAGGGGADGAVAGEGPDAGPPPAPGSPAEALRKRAAAFARFRTPVRASAESVGAYANGCLLGAATLPVSGPGFEVLHVDRNRRFGHPTLVAYIRRLATEAKKEKLAPLLIGDLSQPRGGPAPFGHRSHQSGLDVDIGFTQQPFLKKRRLTAKEREELQPPPVVDLKTRKLLPTYTSKVDRVIELAARDGAVERIFVNPHIKMALCKKRMKDRAWLRLIRPWTFHHDHLHVRLKCPMGSPTCEAQAAVPPGDGCDEVERWVEDEERRLREPPPPPPPEPRVPRPPPPLPPLPAACQTLVSHELEPATSPRQAARDP